MYIRNNVWRYRRKNQHDSHKYITSEGGEDLSNQKLTNCEIEYDWFCCSDCTKSLCLEIKNKMSDLDKLYNITKALNVNYDNEEKCYGVSTCFIRKLTDLFFLTTGEKLSKQIPLSKIYRSRKSSTLIHLYGTMQAWPEMAMSISSQVQFI